MRTFRKTTHARRIGALGLGAAAILAAAACTPSDDKAGATPPARSASPSSSSVAPPPSSSTSAPAAPSASAPGTPSVRPTAPSSAPGRPGEAEGDPTGIDGNCPDEYTDVRVEWAVPPTKDDTKLLLVVTNTGTEPCRLRSHPVLRLETGNGRLVGVFTGSKPATEVILAPGKEAYAGLLLRQSDKGVSTPVRNMALAPHGQRPDHNTGEGVLLQMPKGGVHVDDKARVTYWNSSSEAAVTPLFPH
ncbi:DUF4232 domain-containing protein [Streptomyces sp. NPDC048606]|uniref:DUF4232 domain-containing protein n=1 Tax=Streptomyces sp. NPDC048606 TaxID=3154726 RepID=UPI00343CC691